MTKFSLPHFASHRRVVVRKLSLAKMSSDTSGVLYLKGWCLDPDGNCPGEKESNVDQWEVVDAAIKKHKVIVFSKSSCPYCAKVKRFLADKGIQFTVVELDQNPKGSEIQALLEEHTGQRTVPNVFIKGIQIGGSTDTIEAWENGKIKSLL